MPDLAELFGPIVGDTNVVVGDAVNEDFAHDETLSSDPQMPAAVVRPGTTDEVAEVVRVANEHGIPVTARGTGSGVSGAAIPVEGGIVVTFQRMNRILEIDHDNALVVVEPGVQLDQLDEELAKHGFVYPVRPGEPSATLGGNVNTNAAGMRAVKYGVTRNHVIGLEAVLADGRVVNTGGKVVKISSGYDLTQLIIGSEGTLALVTKVICKVQPRLQHGQTLLVPFPSLDEVTSAIPKILATGLNPLILEYIDFLTMAAITYSQGLELGIPDAIREKAMAYLVISLEGTSEARVDEDTMALGEQLMGELGGMDVYVLPSGSAADLIDAREKAFYTAKGAGADDVIDVVVPRASLSAYVQRVTAISQEHETPVVGCGHAGDGNVHMAIFQKDAGVRSKVMHLLLEAGLEVGGAISGEHGIGREKKGYFKELEDPAKIELMRGIKLAFDPNGILNPGAIFDLD